MIKKQITFQDRLTWFLWDLRERKTNISNWLRARKKLIHFTILLFGIMWCGYRIKEEFIPLFDLDYAAQQTLPEKLKKIFMAMLIKLRFYAHLHT